MLINNNDIQARFRGHLLRRRLYMLLENKNGQKGATEEEEMFNYEEEIALDFLDEVCNSTRCYLCMLMAIIGTAGG